MGKRRSKKPIFHRRIFDAEDLQTETLTLTKSSETMRNGYKLNTADVATSRRYGIAKNNTALLPGQGTHVPLHFVVLLTLFLLSVTLIFCRGRRSKSSKSAPSRRCSGTTATNNTKVVRRTTSVLGTAVEKSASSCDKKDRQNTKKLIKNNGRRKYY